ncbi:hypothetical protein M409DRAFT_16187 [Zasmidium cellare ATCC 36951]|uniref:Zn(2)-C6 fungal-type domain-containing protein n=1 Tax=Zasmidium cellare ATCC 36951 TaxID=1080233 RepID=A0A6A6D6X4_ZASCE|nr:uncharacterized protein M409DRAFT_16187 [Zasmidium cellare ATCC 36951]KAF2173919.1 hypothetical protein M409DRAFT_16187 [Zasmidium cellare ATCC 36951]
MPRLNHKKTRTGCQRCKARKVKCDEQRPKCSACTRHNVSCEYIDPTPRRSDNLSLTTPPAESNGYHGDLQGLDPKLEIRLMHEWTAYTCSSFSTGTEFWRFQAPLFAMEHRMVLDAMFALAALHFSRQSPKQWIPMEGRMVPIRDPIQKPAYATKDISAQWKENEDAVDAANALRNSNNADYVSTKRRQEMLINARVYFDRAIDGHRRGLSALTRENVEAVYITSILVSFHALFTLSDSYEDRTLPTLDPVVWLRLADGTRYLCEVWRGLMGEEFLEANGVYFGRGKLDEEDALFQREFGRPFEKVLTFNEEYEMASPGDKDSYQKCTAYIALVYKSIIEGSEPALANCRRLVALPSRLPKRFLELLDMRAPRAMVLLAHAFALMKLISDTVPWFAGIAEQQVPKIYQILQPGWQELMAWPMRIVEGRSEQESKGIDIRDIISL